MAQIRSMAAAVAAAGLLAVCGPLPASAALRTHGGGPTPAPAPTGQMSQMDPSMPGMDPSMPGMADMPGMDHSGHAAPAAPVDRPRTLVLGGFAAVNGSILLAAAWLRRRGGDRRARRRAARVAAPPAAAGSAATGVAS